jgi:Ser/Thr protein kinase RdoA (MazF antagonist)
MLPLNNPPTAPGAAIMTSEPLSSSAVSSAGEGRAPGGRERFSLEELACVLSHFELGVIGSVVEYPRGSRKAPKLLIKSEQGRYLLKRRARGRDDPFKVAFCHALQMHLAARQFPLPHLVGTRRENNSMLQWKDGVYELFEYIPGDPYPMTLEATFDGGRVLGLYHKLLEDFHSEWQPPTGSYHRAPAVEKGLATIPQRLTGTDATCAFLLQSYTHAADSVEALGLVDWPRQIAHGDWHPGNMLFRDSHVVAVIDYDSARLLPRIIDIANGSLQFSILGGTEDVSRWPEHPDATRFKRFLRGYDQVLLLTQAEIQALPWLMIEALIAEAVFPIAATGMFGRMDGGVFLAMVQRKVVWLQQHADELVQLVES